MLDATEAEAYVRTVPFKYPFAFWSRGDLVYKKKKTWRDTWLRRAIYRVSIGNQPGPSVGACRFDVLFVSR